MSDWVCCYLKSVFLVLFLALVAGCGKAERKETTFFGYGKQREFVIRVIGVDSFSCSVENDPKPVLQGDTDKESLYNDCLAID